MYEINLRRVLDVLCMCVCLSVSGSYFRVFEAHFTPLWPLRPLRLKKRAFNTEPLWNPAGCVFEHPLCVRTAAHTHHGYHAADVHVTAGGGRDF